MTQHAGAPFATHLPWQLDRARGPLGGAPIGHVARQPTMATPGRQAALAIFQGPHAYISPAWYRTTPNVPTWNYIAAHATCAARIVEHPTELRAMLARLVDANEAGFAHPWRMAAARGLHGSHAARDCRLRVAISSQAGQAQAQPEPQCRRRGRDRPALAHSPDPIAAGVGELMREI